MTRPFLSYLTPWKHRRLAEAARVAALRERDGDGCARCRRPMRFDLPAGDERGVVVEPVGPGADDVRLCHPRCNTPGLDQTEAVLERARLKNEAALFARARKRRKRAA